jgi:hypothetical protein
MTLQQAMLNLDDGMPMWIRISGDVFGRCILWVAVIIVTCKALVAVL